MKIGIFDSGRGGELVGDGLKKLLPEHEYLVVNDREHVPYGSRTDAEVTALTEAAIRPLLVAACPIIVIACNTATMAAINTLRQRHPNVTFIGIEPMIKPANLVSATRHITVLATPLTLQSERYRELIASYAEDVVIDQPSAAGWAAAIEHQQGDTIDLDELAKSIVSGSDVIVLACTHYIALKARLEHEFPAVTVLEPTEAIAKRVTALTIPRAQG